VTSTDTRSLAPYEHRVIGALVPAPCASCGGSPRVYRDPDVNNPFSVRCESAGQTSHRGGSKVQFGKTERGAVAAWNLQQANCEPLGKLTPTPIPPMPTPSPIRRHYIEAEDLRAPRPLCKCGLSEPCNGCLDGTPGFQRAQSYGEASQRIRCA
jgi:hypothetical protein